MIKYKLKKDTFFYKAGTICELTPKGNMVLGDNGGTCILHNYQLREHPELLDEWFEKIEEKEYGGRVPRAGAVYWTILAHGEILEDTWYDLKRDGKRFESGSAFWTREEAEKESKRRKAYVILKEDTKGFVPDWKDSTQIKYYVVCPYDGFRILRVTFAFSNKHGILYFKTKEDAEASIKNHHQQWLDYLGVEEEE